MGLQKLFEGQFGPTPYIDLDLQVARGRIPSPQPIDLVALADGVVRNNVGVDAIRLTVRAQRDGDGLILPRTEQRLVVSGMPDDARGPWWLLEAIGPPDGPPLGLRYSAHGDAPGPLTPFPPPTRADGPPPKTDAPPQQR